MKAVVYHGRYDVRVEEVPDPRIEAPRNAKTHSKQVAPGTAQY